LFARDCHVALFCKSAYTLQRTRWMQRTRPLPDCHPELSIIECPSFREYRVENWQLARDGSGNIVRGATSWGWIDLCLPVIFSFIWPRVSILIEVTQLSDWHSLNFLASRQYYLVCIRSPGSWVYHVLPLYASSLWYISTSSVHLFPHSHGAESVLVFPVHGIQLETHRGYPLLKPLFVSRRFIHASLLENFIINEGLRRWNVRYYLAAVFRSSTDMIAIDVAFEVRKSLNTFTFPSLILPWFRIFCHTFLCSWRSIKECKSSCSTITQTVYMPTFNIPSNSSYSRSLLGLFPQSTIS